MGLRRAPGEGNGAGRRRGYPRGYLNGVRVTGRRRLRDGDTIRLRETVLVYRAPPGQTDPTTAAPIMRAPPSLSHAERRVLITLARPCRDAGGLITPASNYEIAQVLGYSVDAIKAHLRVLFASSV